MHSVGCCCRRASPSTAASFKPPASRIKVHRPLCLRSAPPCDELVCRRVESGVGASRGNWSADDDTAGRQSEKCHANPVRNRPPAFNFYSTLVSNRNPRTSMKTNGRSHFYSTIFRGVFFSLPRLPSDCPTPLLSRGEPRHGCVLFPTSLGLGKSEDQQARPVTSVFVVIP